MLCIIDLGGNERVDQDLCPIKKRALVLKIKALGIACSGMLLFLEQVHVVHPLLTMQQEGCLEDLKKEKGTLVEENVTLKKEIHMLNETKVLTNCQEIDGKIFYFLDRKN